MDYLQMIEEGMRFTMSVNQPQTEREEQEETGTDKVCNFHTYVLLAAAESSAGLMKTTHGFLTTPGKIRSKDISDEYNLEKNCGKSNTKN